MGNRDFKQRVLEQQIFDELKDTPLTNCKYLRAKYNGVDVEITRLYRRIVNYQIDRYGCTLNVRVPKKSKEDLLREHQNARNRRYQRRNKGRFEKNKII